jgi:hypothetical protein
MFDSQLQVFQLIDRTLAAGEQLAIYEECNVDHPYIDCESDNDLILVPNSNAGEVRIMGAYSRG